MKPLVRPFLALCLVALAAPAPARDAFSDNLAGYTVEAGILNAPNCAGPAFDDPSLASFEQGLCLFHRPQASAEDRQRAINLLSAAQVRGLPPVPQQLATLIGGLAHCAEADHHLGSYRASGQTDLMARTAFCHSRRQAQAELNAIRWNHALFDYAEGLPPQQSFEARLTDMSACYQGSLAPDFDAECGLLTNLTETEINAFVDAAVGDVIVTYFTGVESPITAMFARKLGRARGLLEAAQAAIAGLAADAQSVNAEYAALNDAYLAARDAKMGPAYAAYTDAILRANAILDEFDRWKGGLFLTSENVNLMPKITERSVEIAEELTRVEDLEFLTKAEALSASVLRLVNGASENRETVAQLCRVYFCELTSRRAMPGLIRACRRPALADNPLCVGQDGKVKSGVLNVEFAGPQQIAVVDLCRGAGVDPAFLVTDMTPASSAICLGAMP